MKTTAVLAVLCIFVSGTTAYGQLSHGRSSHFASLQSRSQIDVCDYTCTGTVKVNESTSWEIDIVSKINGSLIITIGYDLSANVIVIINQRLKIAVAIDGKSGLVVLLCLNTGGSIVINVKTGLSVYAGGNTNLINLGKGSKIEVSALISIAVQIIASGSSSVQQGADGTKGNVFNLTAIVIAIYKDSKVQITAEAFFNGRVDLRNKVLTDFAVWLSIFVDQVSNGDLTISLGIIGFLGPVFDHPNGISISILRVLIALYSSTSGQFDGKLALVLYDILSVDISAEANLKVFVSLISTIRAVGILYVDLNAALTAYLSGSGLISFEQQVVVIGGKTYVVSIGRTLDESWFISLKSLSDDSVDVIVVYVRSNNIFVIYNRKLSIVLVFSGSLGLFAIWNVKTGEGIIVKYSTGAAIVIAADVSISGYFSSGALIQGFVAIAVKIQANASFTYSILNRSTFVFATYIVTLQTAGLTAANLLVSSTVSAIIRSSFSVYFQAIAAAKVGIISVVGVLNVIYVASGGIAGAWSAQIQAFIVAIYSSGLKGQFTYELFFAFYSEVSVNISIVASSNFLANLISLLRGILNILGSVAQTISNALNNLGGGGNVTATTEGSGGGGISGGGQISLGRRLHSGLKSSAILSG